MWNTLYVIFGVWYSVFDLTANDEFFWFDSFFTIFSVLLDLEKNVNKHSNMI